MGFPVSEGRPIASSARAYRLKPYSQWPGALWCAVAWRALQRRQCHDRRADQAVIGKIGRGADKKHR